jgi:bacterioferritin (cytochrome b1)
MATLTTTNISAVVRTLQALLSQEHACNIRYRTHATVLTGPWAESVGARLTEIADDEMKHAQTLRDLIDYMGDEPTMDVANEDLKPAHDLNQILDVKIAEEMRPNPHNRHGSIHAG